MTDKSNLAPLDAGRKPTNLNNSAPTSEHEQGVAPGAPPAKPEASADNVTPFQAPPRIPDYMALNIWSAALDPRGTGAEDYLKSRGIKLTDDVANSVLRFHPRVKLDQLSRLPAMIALFRDIKTDEPVAIHRIWWDHSAKKMLGAVGGAAVKLTPSARVLAIGEGIETSLAARQLGVAEHVWALGSAGAIGKFPLIDGVEMLVILGENDKASRDVVKACGSRWVRAGRQVQVATPHAGKDFNNCLLAFQKFPHLKNDPPVEFAAWLAKHYPGEDIHAEPEREHAKVATGPKAEQASTPGADLEAMAEATDALRYVKPASRETRVEIGMVLHDRFGDAGYHLWVTWLPKDPEPHWKSKADGDPILKPRDRWSTFRKAPGGKTILTLFKRARENGWPGGADDTSGFEKRENVGSEGIGGAAGDAAGADAGDAGNDDKASPLDGLGEWDAGEVTKKPSPREWLLGNVFARRFMSSLLADGGVGKTSVRLLQLISLALGRSLTGEHVFQRCRVLVVSLEDDGEELERRVEATLLHYGIARPELKGWLFLAAPGGTRGKIMTADKRGNTTAGPLKSYIEATIVKRQIDIVSLDPFVKSHKVEENNNSGIDEVVQLLTDMAIKHNIALDAPHHTSKGASDPGNADRGRGASAMKDAARLVYTLTVMSSEEAKAFGISEELRKLYVRMDSGKVNIAPPSGKAKWFRLVGVRLDNGNEHYPNGDEVQAAEPWTPPETWADLSNPLLNQMLTAIDAGLADGTRYTDAGAAKERAAWRVVLKHAPNKSDAQAREIIKTWIKNGVLESRSYHNPVTRTDVLGLYLNTDRRPA